MLCEKVKKNLQDSKLFLTNLCLLAISLGRMALKGGLAKQDFRFSGVAFPRCGVLKIRDLLLDRSRAKERKPHFRLKGLLFPFSEVQFAQELKPKAF
jgi:hypothetical protein